MRTIIRRRCDSTKSEAGLPARWRGRRDSDGRERGACVTVLIPCEGERRGRRRFLLSERPHVWAPLRRKRDAARAAFERSSVRVEPSSGATRAREPSCRPCRAGSKASRG
jgi:hypothetical protein